MDRPLRGWQLLAVTLLGLWPLNLNAWTDGQLLIWMNSKRAQGVNEVARRFENEFGIKVRIEMPENIATGFPLAAQAGQGPDVVIWAHDKVGEWADGGLIALLKFPRNLWIDFFQRLGRQCPTRA